MSNGVYQIRNKLNNKLYIGSCSSIRGIESRWKEHKRTLRENKHHNNHLQNAWNKYGDVFEFSIKEICSPDKCIEREQHYLDNLKPEYNIYKEAGSPKGRIVSEDTKEKIRQKRKNQIITEETKRKISIYHKGRKKSKIHKNKVKSVLWGEHGILRKSKGGRFSGNYKFFNTKNNEEIVCGKFELADKYKIDRSFVCKLCNDTVKQAKGWICIGKI